MTRVLHVGVIGAGVVGGLLVSWYRNRGWRVSVRDPALGMSDRVEACDVVYICVPTPAVPGEDRLDVSAVDVAAEIAADGPPRTIVVRSTVMPGTTRGLRNRHPEHRWICLPEFLTERVAKYDFDYPASYVVGEDSYHHPVDLLDSADVLDTLPMGAMWTRRISCSTIGAEIAKLASNAFYAAKLSFMNQLHDAIPRECSEEVFRVLGELPMVGSNHLDVHQDGYRGFGGKCLPKDAAALVGYAEQAGSSPTVLREALAYNARLRSKT